MAQGQTGWTRLQAVQHHDEALPEHGQGAVGSQGEATGAASGGEQDPLRRIDVEGGSQRQQRLQAAAAQQVAAAQLMGWRLAPKVQPQMQKELCNMVASSPRCDKGRCTCDSFLPG